MSAAASTLPNSESRLIAAVGRHQGVGDGVLGTVHPGDRGVDVLVSVAQVERVIDRAVGRQRRGCDTVSALSPAP